MVQYVDLHTHSTASDGTLTPTQLINSARAASLVGLALTDHDSGNGLLEAQTQAAKIGMRFVPGIEISAEYPQPGTMHILGYYIDPLSPALKSMSDILLEGRNNRNPRIIARLNELGCRITLPQVQDIARRGSMDGREIVVGRPHIAQAMVEARCVSSVKQAFDVYLGTTGAAYFDKERLTVRQALACIHAAGGVAVLAHPVQLRTDNPAALQHVIANLVAAGLDGIEVWHSDHRPQDRQLFLELARRYNLAATGGSDFHGAPKPDIALGLGRDNVRVPVEYLDHLEQAWRNRRTKQTLEEPI
ncbi:MAG: PHP domain-containing protein [Phycisphaerae bacterium]